MQINDFCYLDADVQCLPWSTCNRLCGHISVVVLNRLESTLGTLSERLRELFKLLFLSPHKVALGYPEEVLTSLRILQLQFQNELLDYKDYLTIKAQRNITLTTYPLLSCIRVIKCVALPANVTVCLPVGCTRFCILKILACTAINLIWLYEQSRKRKGIWLTACL